MVSKIWISHSSIVDFNNCPRLYYFKSRYRNPESGNRVQLVNPYLSLGSAVHDAIDQAVNISPSKRSNISLIKKYQKIWENYSGVRGGFAFQKKEDEFKKRGIKMLKKVEKSTLFLRKTLKKDEDLPKITLSKNIYLVGSFDWIEVLSNKNLHIVDFKTGRFEEKNGSWQLPIYQALVQGNYSNSVEKLSYWYLSENGGFVSRKAISLNDFIPKLKEKGLEIEKAINDKNFSCNSRYGKCYWCRDYEKIISGKAEPVGVDERMKKDLYFLTNGDNVLRKIEESDFLSAQEKKVLEMRLQNETIKEICQENEISGKKIEDTVLQIKKKLKDNLSRRELIFFVEELKKNGQKLYD